MEGKEDKEPISLLEVYTLFPYKTRSQCVNTIYVSLVDRCVKIDSNEVGLIRNVPLFPHRIRQDLRGCTISVSAFESEPVIMMGWRQVC